MTEPTITVPKAEWDALHERLADLEAAVRHADRLPPKGTVRHFTFARDAQVREFVDAILWDETLASIVAKCRERFGADRAPSSSAVWRYRKWLRRMKPKKRRHL